MWCYVCVRSLLFSMKVRVRINRQTSRLELPGEEPTLQELSDLVKQTLLSCHGLRSDCWNNFTFLLFLKTFSCWDSFFLSNCLHSVPTQSLVCLWTAQSSCQNPVRLCQPVESSLGIWSVSFCRSRHQPPWQLQGSAQTPQQQTASRLLVGQLARWDYPKWHPKCYSFVLSHQPIFSLHFTGVSKSWPANFKQDSICHEFV